MLKIVQVLSVFLFGTPFVGWEELDSNFTLRLPFISYRRRWTHEIIHLSPMICGLSKSRKSVRDLVGSSHPCNVTWNKERVTAGLVVRFEPTAWPNRDIGSRWLFRLLRPAALVWYSALADPRYYYLDVRTPVNVWMCEHALSAASQGFVRSFCRSSNEPSYDTISSSWSQDVSTKQKTHCGIPAVS